MKGKLILLIAACILLSSSHIYDQPQILSGTKWVASGEGTAGDDDTIPFTFTETITFISDNTFSNIYTDSLGEKSDPKSGTYVYSHPTITLTFKSEAEGEKDEVFSGTVKDNQMIFTGITFIKQ